MQIRKSYQFITGQGLGTSYSSHSQIGSLSIAEEFGQAKIKVFANVSNGNLVIHDHSVRIIEAGTSLNLFYVYNSQADSPDTAWRFAVSDRFIVLPSITEPLGTSATLIECDGHKTIFTQHPIYKTLYFAPGLSSGTPYLYFDYTNKLWIKYHPGTKITELYDIQGYLKKRIDAAGHTLVFEYDDKTPAGAEKPLIMVKRQGGDTQYEFRRTASPGGFTLGIYSVSSGVNKLLLLHQFDGKSKKTIIPDPVKPPADWYTIVYQYGKNINELVSLTQTDGTSMAFSFKPSSGIQRLSDIYTGKEEIGSNPTRFVYEDKSSTVTIRENGVDTKIMLDPQKRVAQVIRPQGREAKIKETTQYRYSSSGQLASILYPDNGQEIYEYNNAYGLRTKHIKPDGQIKEYHHDRGDTATLSAESKDADRQPNCITEVSYPKGKENPVVVRYIYDRNYDGHGNCFLRFVISSLGCVTEYRPTLNGYIASERTYLKSAFNLRPYPPHLAPSLPAVLEWIRVQDPRQISLIDYHYNPHGQMTKKLSYTKIKTDGQGEETKDTGKEEFVWDNFGCLLKQEIAYDEKAIVETDHAYDSLYRISRTTDALDHTTTYTYLDKERKHQIKYPNGRTETKRLNTLGSAASTEGKVILEDKSEQIRLTSYNRDSVGRPIVTIGEDKRQVITFYDAQDRLVYSISATGMVIGYEYNNIHCYHAVTQYAQPVNIRDFWFPEDKLPSFGIFVELALKKDLANDRTRYTFFNSSGKERYQVDENQNLVEFIYDKNDRLITKIAYLAPLTSAQLDRLIRKIDIGTLPFDAKKDRCSQTFYDDDHNIIGEQNSGGYVTEYKRDIAGRLRETIAYHIPSVIVREQLSFERIRPILSPKDSHVYRYPDSRNQAIIEVHTDGENYFYTAHNYLAYGLKAQTVQFSSPITDSDWLRDKSQIPLSPVITTEDRHTVYEYDLLGCEIRRHESNARCLFKQRDEMGNIILESTYDAKAIASVSPDAQRRTLRRYDGWEQVTHETTPFVAQWLVQVDKDEKLTPEQKAALTSAIWQYASIRHLFDAVTGLRLRTSKPKSVQMITLDIAQIIRENDNTVFYYDKERRPIVTIDPTGAVVELSYNVFNEITKTRKYFTRLSAEILPTLKGGFLPDELRRILDALQNDKDAITSYKTLDKCRRVLEITDPENYVSRATHNPYNEVIEEIHSLTATSRMTIRHDYDAFGREIGTTHLPLEINKEEKRESKTGPLTVRREFDSPFMLPTAVTDECSETTRTEFDAIGAVKSIIDPQGAAHTFKRDAFSRIIEEKNSMGCITKYNYDQVARSKTIISPITEIKTVICTNIFDETIQHINPLGKMQLITHAPDGQVVDQIDELKRVTHDAFNLLGQRYLHITPAEIKKTYSFDGVGNITREVVDADEKGLQLTTTTIPNAWGGALITVDPCRVKRINIFNRCNKPIKTVTDPSSFKNLNGLGLITKMTYNGKGESTSLTRGDAKDENQSLITYQRDDFNRYLGKTIDPASLAITTTSRLDGRGRTIVELDPDGNITRHLYTNGRKRFTIDPLGGIIEWQYDMEGNEILYREYDTKIDPSILTDITTAEAIAKLVTPTAMDTLKLSFYDDLHRLRFSVNSLGTVTEICYDMASRIIKTIRYKTPLDPSTLSTQNYSKLVLWVKTIAHRDDRYTYRIVDEVGQECFSIDEENYITQKTFDALGQVIIERNFAAVISNPERLASLSPEEVSRELKPDPIRDYTTYTIFDARRKPWFVIKSSGETSQFDVTRYDHDENGNLIQLCEFASWIDSPTSYEALVTIVKSLTPDPTKGDRITIYTIDAANRTSRITDALGNKDEYQLDALGNVVTHTDRAGAVWKYEHDRAERCIRETTPSIDIAQTAINPSDSRKLIIVRDEKTSIKKRIDYSKAGRILKTIQAEGTVDERTFESTYNFCGQLAETKLPAIAIDAGFDAKASFTTRPEVTRALTTSIIYNAKGLPVVKKNEAGNYSFTVFDSEKQPIYEIDTGGYPKEKKRNSFGEVFKEIRYATPVDFDLKPYAATGVPLLVVKDSLAKIKKAGADRSIEYKRDKRGDCTAKKFDEVFYSVSDAKPSAASDFPEIRMDYDAFRNLISKKQAYIDQSGAYVWNETTQWFDHNKKLVAIVDINGYITRYTRNRFGDEIKRVEPAKFLMTRPSATDSINVLDKFMADLTPADTDRQFTIEYDLLGRKVKETRSGLLNQEPAKAEEKTKSGIKNTIKTLIRTYRYGSTSSDDKPIAIQYENASVKYFYYNTCQWLIGETDVDRLNPDGMKLTPFIAHKLNAFGQTVAITRFKQSATDPRPFIVPDVKADSADQIKYTLYDKRGLPIVEQDALQHATATTYTSTGKIQRNYYLLTNLDSIAADSKEESKEERRVLGKAISVPVPSIDEKFTDYDILDNPTRVSYRRDGIITSPKEDVTETEYNAFGEPITQGCTGESSRSIYWKYDQLGRIWSTNSGSGISRILVYNLHSLQSELTGEWSSPNPAVNLRNTTYDQLLSLSSLTLQRTKYIRDQVASADPTQDMRMTTQILPEYTSDVTEPDDVPLNITVTNVSSDTRTVISWPIPQERNIDKHRLKFSLWPINNPSAKTTLDINFMSGHCEVDASTLTTNVYQYQIDYYIEPPYAVRLRSKSLEDKPIYRSQGSLQLATPHTRDSLTVVPIAQPNGIVLLTGKVQHIARVTIEAKGQPSFERTVQTEEKTGDKFVDIRDQPSGYYKFKPVTTDGSDLPPSLPITVYTTLPALTPLAREINCETTITTLDNWGKIQWKVPAVFAAQKIKINCQYVADDDKTYSQESALDTTTDLGSHDDHKGHVLEHCNLQFEHNVKEIKELSFALQVDESTWAVLRNAEVPLAATKRPTQDIIAARFKTRDVAYITSLPERKSVPQLQYLDTSLDRFAKWKSTPLLAIGTTSLSIDVTDLPQGFYPFKLTYDSSFEVSSAFTTGHDGIVYPASAWTAQKEMRPKSSLSSATSETPRRQFGFDRWNNVVLRTDAEGNTTKIINNLFDQTIHILQPSTSYIDETGLSHDFEPEKFYLFDDMGNKVAFFNTKINSHSKAERWELDAAGQVIRHTLGNGLVLERTSWFNCLGQVEKYTDSRSKEWKQTFDHMNRLLSVTNTLLGIKRSYTYNELGKRSSSIDPASNTTYYLYDIRGNCNATVLPQRSERTTRLIDRNRLPLEIYNPAPSPLFVDYKLSWVRDYFGHPTTHVDASGATVTYSYDNLYQLLRQRSSGGIQPETAEMPITRQWRNVSIDAEQPLWKFVDEYTLQRKPIRATDFEYTYDASRLTSVTDHISGKCTQYGYDKEGRRISSETSANGLLLQKIHAQYDSLGRDIWTFDTFMTLYTGYDEAGNRRYQKASLALDLSGSITTMPTERWFTYDNADRILIDGGKLEGGRITISAQGTRIEYEAGLRKREYTAATTRTLDYDDAERLTTITGEGGSGVREYDPQGYVKKYIERSEADTHTTIIECDKNSWETSTDQDGTKTEFKPLSGTGLPLGQLTVYRTGGEIISDDLHFEYKAYGDEVRQTKVSGTRYRPSAGRAYSAMEQLWDASGAPRAVLGAFDTGDTKQKRIPDGFYFDTTPEGQVLTKWSLYGTARNLNPSGQRFWGDGYIRYFYDVNGFHWGSYQIDYDNFDSRKQTGSSLVDYIRFYGSQGKSSECGFIPSWGARYTSRNKRTPKSIELSDPIKKSSLFANTYPPLVPGNYAVGAGDTFETIADKLYGDAAYASLIAEANGFSVGSQIEQGQVLTVPPLYSVHNTSQTHENYQQFMALLIGHVSLHLNTPQPDEDDDDFFGELVGVLIAGIAIIAAPYLAAEVLPLLGFAGAATVGSAASVAAAAGVTSAVGVASAAATAGTAATIGAGVATAVSAFLVDAAGQGLAVAAGLQKHFSVKTALDVGLSAGLYLTAGASQMAAAKTVAELGKQVVTLGKLAITRQLSEMALGIRKEFDVKAVLSSIASQTADLQLSGMNLQLDSRLARLITVQSMSATSDNLISAAITGTPINISSIAAQALGATLVTELGEHMPTASRLDYAVAEADVEAADVRTVDRHGTTSASASTAESKAVRTFERKPVTKPASSTKKPFAARDRFFVSDDYLKAKQWAEMKLDDSITLDPSDPRWSSIRSEVRQTSRQVDTKGVGTGRMLKSFAEGVLAEVKDYSRAALDNLDLLTRPTAIIKTAIALGVEVTITPRQRLQRLEAWGSDIYSEAKEGNLFPLGKGIVDVGTIVLSGLAAAKLSRVGVFGGEGARLFRTVPTSLALNEGTTPISRALVDAMRNKGRTIDIAVKGSDDYRYLKSMGAEGSTNTATPNHILIREDASKSTLLEEFLHGTQNKLGIVNRLTPQGAEVHVKDFMIRHAKLIGLNNSADLRLLRQLKLEEIERLNLMQV